MSFEGLDGAFWSSDFYLTLDDELGQQSGESLLGMTHPTDQAPSTATIDPSKPVQLMLDVPKWRLQYPDFLRNDDGTLWYFDNSRKLTFDAYFYSVTGTVPWQSLIPDLTIAVYSYACTKQGERNTDVKPLGAECVPSEKIQVFTEEKNGGVWEQLLIDKLDWKVQAHRGTRNNWSKLT